MAAAMHTVPVFLVVGRRAAGKSTFVARSGVSRDDASFVEFDVHEDPRAGARELAALIDKLAKSTVARPLAGVIVVIPLGDLASDAHYAALRPVLDAVVTGCGALVPIHLVVTHIDAVPGHAEYVAATSRHPSALGVRLPLVTKPDPNRWTDPIAKLTDSVFETSVALVHGAAKHSPLRFGSGIRALAPALEHWLRRLGTPSRGAQPLLPRSVFLGSTLAMPAIVEDGGLSRVTSRRLTRSALRWTLPVGLLIFLGAGGTSAFLLRPQPEPEPTAPEAIAEAPAETPKKKKPGFVLDTRPPGPKFPPPVCAAAALASGEWAFQTMVTATNPGNESGIGIRGIYTLALDATECDLDLTVTKTGFVSSAGAPTTYAKPQIGVDPIDEAFVEASGDTQVLWLPVVLDMNNTSGTDPLKQEFTIGFRIDAGVATRITGEWRQAGSARSSTGYWGYLEGGRDGIEPAPASAQVCRVQCRLACGWSDQARVDRCRESCAADVLLAVATCPS
jgi:hypothetical protein